MKLLKKIPLAYEDKDYEIRILAGVHDITIAAFQNNFPANGFRHQIKITKNTEPEKLIETEAFKEVVEISKKEILENRWGKMQAVIDTIAESS